MRWPMEKWTNVLHIVSGKSQKAVLDSNGPYPVYGSGGIMGRANQYLCEAGTTIVGRKGTIDNPIFVNERFWNVDTAFGISPGNRLVPRYLYFFCRHFNFRQLDKSTTIPSLAKSDLLSIEMPVPPLPEQKRIVAKIEELFSDLDNGVETLKKAKQQLAVYRQAVLKQVFEAIAKQCVICNVKEVCKDIKVGIVIKPSQYYTTEEHGIRAFRSANVREFQINDADWVYLTKAGHNANRRSEIHTGDVLVVRSGYPGTACVVTPDFDGCNAIDILIAVPDRKKVLPEYLCAYTNSPLGRKIVQEKKRGVAQSHFNVSGYAQTTILLPSLQLQEQVVFKIKERLSACDNIEQSIDAALHQAESMRQRILKKAFEGAL